MLSDITDSYPTKNNALFVFHLELPHKSLFIDSFDNRALSLRHVEEPL